MYYIYKNLFIGIFNCEKIVLKKYTYKNHNMKIIILYFFTTLPMHII